MLKKDLEKMGFKRLEKNICGQTHLHGLWSKWRKISIDISEKQKKVQHMQGHQLLQTQISGIPVRH
jgi:hypothetical protein